MVLGSNVAVSAPHGNNIRHRLQSLDFLVVSDFFLSETAQLADVVLPSAQWAEEEGTMTNLEGRVIRRRRAFEPPTGTLTDLDLMERLAERLDKSRWFSYPSTEAVFEELRAASAGGAADYSGITYEKIEANQGVFWPCSSVDHPGTPRMFTESFPTLSHAWREGEVPPGPAPPAGRGAGRGLPPVPDHRPGPGPGPVGYPDPEDCGTAGDGAGTHGGD